MSIEAVAWALNVKVGDPLSKLILIALANHTDPQNECFPSRKRVSEYAECSLDTVDRRIAILCKAGFISKSIRRTASGDQTSNLYRLNLGPLAAATPAANSGPVAAGLCGPNHQGKKEAPDGASKGVPVSEQAIFIAALFNRRFTTPWSEKEIKAFKKLGLIEMTDLKLVNEYYISERAKGGDGIHRRDLLTFVNNFMGELDRARAWQTNPNANAKTRKNSPGNRDRNEGTFNAGKASLYAGQTGG